MAIESAELTVETLCNDTERLNREITKLVHDFILRYQGKVEVDITVYDPGRAYLPSAAISIPMVELTVKLTR